MVKKIIHCIYILLFLAMMLVPLYFTNTRKYSVSEIDNRTLAQAPDLQQENFPSAFETYLKDRIGFRSEMINSYNVLNDALADELTHPHYTYGKDGQVFFKMTPNLTYNEYHQAFAEFVKKMQDYCESRGIGFYFAFEPEKASVMRDYLPEGVNYDDSWVDQMLAYMDSMGVHYIDNKSCLIEKSKTEQVFNVQYDAGHWNDLGCFYGTSNIFSRIHQDYPEVTELQRDEYIISTRVEPYLPVSQFEINETVPYFDRIDGRLDITPKYTQNLYVDPAHFHCHYFLNNAENSESFPDIMFFQASYYNNRPQFPIARTHAYIGIHSYQNVFNVDYYTNAFNPDIVVFEVAEYTLIEAYFHAASLLDPGWNPPLVDARLEQPVSEQLQSVISSCSSLSDKELFVLPYDALEKVYIYDEDLREMEYLYLIADGRVLDLQKDSLGFYSAMVGVDTDLSSAQLIAVSFDGQYYSSDLQVKKAQLLQDQIVEFSAGSEKAPDPSVYKDELGTLTDPYEISTDTSGNRFDSLVVQLLDVNATTFIDTLHTSTEEEKVSDAFLCRLPTGWYRFRMKANSNKKDEFIDYLVYLESGDYYAYSYQVNKLSDDTIVFSSFEISGPGESSPVQKDMVGDLIVSDGTTIASDQSITFATQVDGNRFNTIAMLTAGVESENGAASICTFSAPGEYRGYYSHNLKSASYYVVLKGNSNLKDEFIEFICDLEQGSLYEYSFTIETFTETEIVIRDFRFEQVSD